MTITDWKCECGYLNPHMLENCDSCGRSKEARMNSTNTARKRFEDTIKRINASHSGSQTEATREIMSALDTYTNELLEEAAVEIAPQGAFPHELGSYLNGIYNGKKDAAALLRSKKV